MKRLVSRAKVSIPRSWRASVGRWSFGPLTFHWRIQYRTLKGSLLLADWYWNFPQCPQWRWNISKIIYPIPVELDCTESYWFPWWTQMNSKEEEDLPDPHETLLERSHRDFWDTKERLKTAIHIKEIGEYKDGLMSCDELYLRISQRGKPWY